MKNRFRIGKVILLSTIVSSSHAATAPAMGPHLNVVVILVDDLGYGDLACYGNPTVRTPHIDRVAAEGMRFTQAYAAGPVCSPARAGLLTGQWPVRSNITDAIGDAGDAWNKGRKLLQPEIARHLDLGATTLAKVFQSQGYATASIGKWHLGDVGYLPQDQGFDVNFAGSSVGSHKSIFGPDYGVGLPVVPASEYLTERLQTEAERFIDGHRRQPFFLYLSHYAVHRPIAAKPETIAHYPAKGPAPWGLLPAYAAMIEDVDQSVGRMMAYLKAQNLNKNTVVIVTSDNGAVRQWASNGGLRGSKGLLYEGGIRVPLIVRLPDGTGAGTTCSIPVHSCDLFPTLLELAGLAPSPAPAGDGVSLVPLLKSAEGVDPERPLFWHYPHYNMHGARPGSAIRIGDFKLIEFFETNHCELYNLREDPAEAHDLATDLPATVHRLQARLHQFWTDTGARLPMRNPDYKGVEPILRELVPGESTRTVSSKQ